MNAAVKLDRWESQFVLYAKGHLHGWEEKNETKLHYEEVCRNIWGNRCGIVIEPNEIGYIAHSLIELVQKVGLISEPKHLVDFVMDLAPRHKYSYEIMYKDNVGYLSNIVRICLFSYLSTLRVIADNGDVLIEFEEFEPDLCVKGVNE